MAAWAKGEFFAPSNIELDLSNRCNLGCNFCHFAYTHQRGPLAAIARESGIESLGDIMEWGLLKSILKQLAENGVEAVTYSGGGEPTLYPNFIGALEFAQLHKLAIGLYTNATLIDEEKAAAIKELCRWVVVSLDLPHAKAYEEAKGVDAFGRAIEGIRRLVAANGKARIVVSFLLGPGNYGLVGSMFNVHRELCTDSVEFRPRVLYDLHHPDQVVEETGWIEKAIKTLESLKLIGRSDVEIPLVKFRRLANWERGYTSCEAVKFTGVITPDGRLWACVNRRGFPESEIGDLRKETFREAWSKQTARDDFQYCRVLCRGDSLNLSLQELKKPVADKEFI